MILTESELTQLRADETVQMPDTCRITRASGEPVWDQETGELVPPEADVIYEGVCRVAASEVDDRTVQLAERATDLEYYKATLPYDSPEFLKDDDFEVLTSADPQLVGRPLQVQSASYNSLHTKRRLILEEVR